MLVLKLDFREHEAPGYCLLVIATAFLTRVPNETFDLLAHDHDRFLRFRVVVTAFL
jgi:hypothetical protein